MKKQFISPSIKVVGFRENIMDELILESGGTTGEHSITSADAKEETWGFGFDDLDDEE